MWTMIQHSFLCSHPFQTSFWLKEVVFVSVAYFVLNCHWQVKYHFHHIDGPWPDWFSWNSVCNDTRLFSWKWQTYLFGLWTFDLRKTYGRSWVVPLLWLKIIYYLKLFKILKKWMKIFLTIFLSNLHGFFCQKIKIEFVASKFSARRIDYDQSIIWGDPPIFLEFYVPLPTPFYCVFKKEFLKISEIWSFMSGNFFRKISQNFPKISWNFPNFFKIKKLLFWHLK